MSTRRGFLMQSIGLVIASRLPFLPRPASDVEYAEGGVFPAPWLEVWLDGLKYDCDERCPVRAQAGRRGWVDRLVIFPPPPLHIDYYARAGWHGTPNGGYSVGVRRVPCGYPNCGTPGAIDRIYGHTVIRLKPDCPAYVRSRVERERGR